MCVSSQGAGAVKNNIYAVFDNFQALPAYCIQYDSRTALAGSGGVPAPGVAGAMAAMAAGMGGPAALPGMPPGWPVVRKSKKRRR